MSRQRRNFNAKFKSDLVIELLKGEKDLNTGGADIFLDHLPINVRDGSSCYKSKTSSVLKWAHSSK